MDWKANHQYMCFRMILMPTTRHDRMDIQLGLFSVISYLYPEFAAATLLSFWSFCLYFMYSARYALPDAQPTEPTTNDEIKNYSAKSVLSQPYRSGSDFASFNVHKLSLLTYYYTAKRRFADHFPDPDIDELFMVVECCRLFTLYVCSSRFMVRRRCR